MPNTSGHEFFWPDHEFFGTDFAIIANLIRIFGPDGRIDRSEVVHLTPQFLEDEVDAGVCRIPGGLLLPPPMPACWGLTPSLLPF